MMNFPASPERELVGHVGLTPRRSPGIRFRRSLILRYCLLPIVCCLFLPGCRTSNQTELIENELRIKDRQLEELRGILHQRDCDLKNLEHDMERLQRKPKAGEMIPSPLLVESVTLGRLTGAIDEDPHCVGD